MQTPPQTASLFRAQNLRVGHAGEPPLVSHWSAALGAGVHLLHGDTGSGKSSLLRVLAGEAAASGLLTLGGVAFDTAGEAGRAAYRTQVFWCDPARRDFDALTPREAVAALAEVDGSESPNGAAAEAWPALTAGFALDAHLDKPLYMLSTGSKRKVWLAAALLSPRPLILLDEPAAALDGPSIRCLWNALGAPGIVGNRVVLVASGDRIDDRVPLAGVHRLPMT
jgi:ABC-2 type transport system ATP-binding protein